MLLTPDYLSMKMIGHHNFAFHEKILVINNVRNLEVVKAAADDFVRKGILTKVLIAEELAYEALSFFCLKRSDFPNDWVYYNALGPLIAIFALETEYLLYHTGDVFLDKPVEWIPKSIQLMEKNPQFQVANLIWNQQLREVQKESYRKSWNFFYAKDGFSDQQFLVKKSTFRAPIYGEIRPDSQHFPRGDVFEKRVFSFLKNRNFERIICRKGSYTHENIRPLLKEVIQ